MDTAIRRSNENLTKKLRTPANIRINLITPETKAHAEHFAADGMDLPLLLSTQLFQKFHAKIIDVRSRTSAEAPFKIT